MPERVFRINVGVIVFEVTLSCIIRRVDVNNIYLSSMSIGECNKCFKIISLNKNMIRSIRVFADDCPFFHFLKDWKLGAETFFHGLWFYLPIRGRTFCGCGAIQ